MDSGGAHPRGDREDFWSRPEQVERMAGRDTAFLARPGIDVHGLDATRAAPYLWRTESRIDHPGHPGHGGPPCPTPDSPVRPVSHRP